MTKKINYLKLDIDPKKKNFVMTTSNGLTIKTNSRKYLKKSIKFLIGEKIIKVNKVKK